jgi:hypothetical protein
MAIRRTSYRTPFLKAPPRGKTDAEVIGLLPGYLVGNARKRRTCDSISCNWEKVLGA